MKTVAFHTLGCKVNTYESNAMLKIFNDAGYQEVDFKQLADVYVINTCTVTNTGDSKSRQMIRKAIRKNPQATICVVGCYSQIAPEEIEQIEGVGVVLGTQYRQEIVKYVNEYLETGKMVVKVDNIMNLKKFEDLNIDRFKNTRAFLKIQDGCNNFCTYCIIPYARGRVRSRDKDSVLNQAQRLVANGYVEIVLTGIHTAGYGEDLEDYSFYDLLVDLVKIEGLKRLRISSIETSQISDEIIELIGSNEIIVDHLHVPLQAGCDETLRRMNRKYTTNQYLEKINKIRSYLPNIAFTTDVIVGFPGETDEEFDETYNFIKKVNYSELHVFPYSPRKNTPAAKMPNQVNDQIKHDRSNRLLALSKELNRDFALKQIGKSLKVLFEKRDGEYLIGHASDYLKVKVKTDRDMIGEIVDIKIDRYDGMLEGSVV
ncbi:MAG: tRNA (N(6)-L-threonylcarbamoyladenosine(37)-C(2))-methylthiotransferase MtaB [Thomasclavelia sp.]|uniref:tRNA (N(6)-L-threonylcarbamoyladenosine(37)-C(2))- methylthiotransferase MtaB n=1 Tax=Thomasclavelia sp. TaxID=3025757 RepID=UPI0039A3B1F4